MGHVFVYVLLTVFHLTTAEETISTTTEYYTTVESTEISENIVENNDDTPTSNISVPTPPRNLTVIDITPHSLLLEWRNPMKMNGAIEGYRIYYTSKNNTELHPDRIPFEEPIIQYNLTKLTPLTEYTIFVKAISQKTDGEPSDSIIATTDIYGPSNPKIINITCGGNYTIYVHFGRPDKYYYAINYYHIYINLDNRIYRNVTISTDATNLQTAYTFKDLPGKTYFHVRLQASTLSPKTNRLIYGELVGPVRVYVSGEQYNPTCQEPSSFYTNASELGVGMLAGVLVASVALALAGILYLLWAKCIKAPYFFLDTNRCIAAPLNWNAPAPPVEDDDPETDFSGPIPVAQFNHHVQRLHADSDIGFSKEYEAIQNDAANEGHSSEQSQHPDNKPKNRYLNIIAYDHSRVNLLPLPGQKVPTYINANYIDGFSVAKAYIGTQGPLPSTYDCFWRMVWEQRVTIIVMITNLVERGRRKCDMYWPKEGTETYGLIQVRLVKEEVMATYTIRTMVITHTRINLKNKKLAAMAEKTVYQYHYTNWPDHGTPDHPLPVIHFVKKSSAANPPNSGPIIVHCSAGVGRTGTYIVLDAMLKQIRARGEVNVFGFLKHIRAQRNFLVQTEEQYIFIHDALLEAIECGETTISREKFPRYVTVLQNHNAEEDKEELWKPLDVQFRLITSYVPKDFNLVSAHKTINKSKNRCGVLIPVENSRVHLTPKAGQDGTDYINASWLQGFHSLREFIITQHPFKHTLQNFWQMVWDHSVQLIVMLSYIDNADYEVFWPVDEEVVATETFTCRQVIEHGNTTFYMREFIMKSVQDDYEIRIKMVHCHNWPHHIVDASEMLHLPDFVQELQKLQSGPVVIVDRLGGTEGATFCALLSLKKHFVYDSKIDVYMYAKLYHNKRPGIWISSDDYIKIHTCMQTLCTPPEALCEVVVEPDMNNGTIRRAVRASVHDEFVRIPPEEVPLITQEKPI